MSDLVRRVQFCELERRILEQAFVRDRVAPIDRLRFVTDHLHRCRATGARRSI